MTTEREAAEIIRPGNVTHYDPPYLKRVISELLRTLANERREHARELREVTEQSVLAWAGGDGKIIAAESGSGLGTELEGNDANKT